MWEDDDYAYDAWKDEQAWEQDEAGDIACPWDDEKPSKRPSYDEEPF